MSFTNEARPRGLERWDLTGEYQGGEVALDDPVSLPIVMLTLRLALGRWAYWVPRTGEWQQTPGY